MNQGVEPGTSMLAGRRSRQLSNTDYPGVIFFNIPINFGGYYRTVDRPTPNGVVMLYMS